MKVLISISKTADPIHYTRAVEQAHGEVHAEYLPRFDPSYDALILAGGGDITPSLFGQKNYCSRNIDTSRDLCELALLEKFLNGGKAVLGICRGHQLINVWAGGGIIQDLGEQNAIHRWDGYDKIHLVSADGILKELYGPLFRVNSAHHQSAGPLGKGFTVTARSADGVIEAMEHTSLPILTTQFHPERMVGEGMADGSRIFRRFLENNRRL